MLDAATGPVGVALAVVMALLAYGMCILQLRRRFPGAWGNYAFQFVGTGMSATAVGLLRGTEPLLLASMPLSICVIALVAGKGSIAVLVHDPDSEEEMPPETRRARSRFGVLLTVVLVVGFVVYLVVA